MFALQLIYNLFNDVDDVDDVDVDDVDVDVLIPGSSSSLDPFDCSRFVAKN